jgi:superfamily I DNA/RNA helicase
MALSHTFEVMRHLINEDGQPFDSEELLQLRLELDSLSDEERVQFRNNNATSIAEHEAQQILIVSGPGTGKSTVFKHRVVHWLQADPDARILVLSFVRKLVTDLSNDIETAPELTEEQKRQVEVHTLHRYARSIVERNHGHSQIQFQPHLRIIGPQWKEIVWHDVLLLAKEADENEFGFKQFEKQLHDAEFKQSERWERLRATYFALSKFYNAAGFADLIIHATQALSENAELKEYQFFIIDEYQDFNEAEDELIVELTGGGIGKLVVGDDDQVLYETLKSGKAGLIRKLYADTEYVNAMLPYCSRSRCAHIVKAAENFLRHDADAEAIAKIYLPLQTNEQGRKVQVIGCATPGAAVDYISTFIDTHREEIEQRKADLQAGNEKDPFLLILTPQREAKFYATKKADAHAKLKAIVAAYKAESQRFSEDYFRALTYYSLAGRPENNFTFRKVMYFEKLPVKSLGRLLRRALDDGSRLSAIRDSEQPIDDILHKSESVKVIIDGNSPVEDKVRELGKVIEIFEPDTLCQDLTRHALNQAEIERTEAEEEKAELDELDAQRMSAVDLITMFGAKGLSADHVVIVGFDDVNMAPVTRNAFYVALTRARESLHLVTALKARGSKTPHAFLEGLPEQHLEFHTYGKTKHKSVPLPNALTFRQYLDKLVSAVAWARSKVRK